VAYNPPHNYAASVLTAADHQSNLFDAATRNNGIYSLVNGALDATYFSTRKAKAANIIPGEHYYPQGEITRRVDTFFDETMSGTQDTDIVGTTRGFRVFLPMSYQACMVQWCLYVSQFRIQTFAQEYASGGDPVVQYGTNEWTIVSAATQTMFLEVYINGTAIPGARMRLPITVHIEKDMHDVAGRFNSLRTVYENTRAQTHTGGKLLLDNGGGNAIRKGLNTVEIRLRMERPGSQYDKVIAWESGGSGAFDANVEFRQRVSLGNGSFVFIPLDGHGP
jgi:hypothetical protein